MRHGLLHAFEQSGEPRRPQGRFEALDGSPRAELSEHLPGARVRVANLSPARCDDQDDVGRGLHQRAVLLRLLLNACQVALGLAQAASAQARPREEGATDRDGREHGDRAQQGRPEGSLDLIGGLLERGPGHAAHEPGAGCLAGRPGEEDRVRSLRARVSRQHGAPQLSEELVIHLAPRPPLRPDEDLGPFVEEPRTRARYRIDAGQCIDQRSGVDGDHHDPRGAAGTDGVARGDTLDVVEDPPARRADLDPRGVHHERRDRRASGRRRIRQLQQDALRCRVQ